MQLDANHPNRRIFKFVRESSFLFQIYNLFYLNELANFEFKREKKVNNHEHEFNYKVY